MEVRDGTLDIRGTANHAVSFEYDPTSTGECGDWEGVLVNRGTFTATHALFSKTTRGVRVYNSDATVSDVRIEKVCAPAANAAEPGLPIAGLHVAGGESDIRRVVVEDVRAAQSASVFGQPGYDAAGIWIEGSRTSALEDLTITTIRATSGQDGLLAGGPDGLSGTLGGDGGDARGIHLDDMANADVDLDVTRVVVSDVIGGADADLHLSNSWGLAAELAGAQIALERENVTIISANRSLTFKRYYNKRKLPSDAQTLL